MGVTVGFRSGLFREITVFDSFLEIYFKSWRSTKKVFDQHKSAMISFNIFYYFGKSFLIDVEQFRHV